MSFRRRTSTENKIQITEKLEAYLGGSETRRPLKGGKRTGHREGMLRDEGTKSKKRKKGVKSRFNREYLSFT